MIAVPFTLLVLTPLLSGAIKAQGHYVPMSSVENLEGTQWATFQSKRDIPRQGRNYEDDTIGGEAKTVDLHKGEFCVDVSTYTEIEYDSAPKEVCDSTFSKQCEDKNERVITPIIPSLNDSMYLLNSNEFPVLIT